MIETLLKPRELAECWNISLSKLYALVRNEGLPCVLVGGMRFRPSSCERWLDERENDGGGVNDRGVGGRRPTNGRRRRHGTECELTAAQLKSLLREAA